MFVDPTRHRVRQPFIVAVFTHLSASCVNLRKSFKVRIHRFDDLRQRETLLAEDQLFNDVQTIRGIRIAIGFQTPAKEADSTAEG